ncbi:MAG TPA: hypothetical protein VIH18_00855 [Candidatus Binatia bacterium]|jgi:hypothetical protein
MKQRIQSAFSALTVVFLLSCAPSHIPRQLGGSDSIYENSDREKSSSQSLSGGSSNRSREYRKSPDDKAAEIRHGAKAARASYEDRTQEVVAHAEKLIEKNQKEGAVLDQRWYGLKYFGKHQELIFNAAKVMFMGGRENEARKQLSGRYTSIDPVGDNQDSGDIQLFVGKRKQGDYDFIVIGQNGKEVALKTIIRLLYLAIFVDEQTRQKYRDKIESFKESLEVLMSSVSARQEYIAFFNKHGIDNPDAVMIGFRGDIRSLMKEDGIRDPESYTDESLRVNWYRDANGMKVLLVSIDLNRIFASRAGELIEAIFAISASASTPPSITFLGSGGAIDAPEMVGQIVTPSSVMNGYSYPASRNRGVLVHIIRNRAADQTATKTADVSVESVVVETTQWAKYMKDHRIDTVDQELFHIMNAINSSPYAGKVELFIGTLVTDNVSSDARNRDMTVEHAEEVISKTADIRREFLSKVLKQIGILKNEAAGPLRQSPSSETPSVRMRGG